MMDVLTPSLLRATPKNMRTLGWGGRDVRILISREKYFTRFPRHTLTTTVFFLHLASYTSPNPPWPRCLPICISFASMMALFFSSAPL